MKKYLILCVFFLLFSGVSSAGSLSSEGGRFVFGQISEFRQDQFMLDTQNGELWGLVVTKDGLRILEAIVYKYGEVNYFLSPADNKNQTIKKPRDLLKELGEGKK